jgi:hypothetical protein
VNPAVLSNRQLRSTNCAHGDRAIVMSINGERPRKVILPGLTSNVKNVTTLRIALVVNEMDDTFAVHDGLRLNSAIRRAEEFNLLRTAPGILAGQQKKREQEWMCVLHNPPQELKRWRHERQAAAPDHLIISLR